MITVRIDKSKECTGDYSMFVSFPYNDELVQIVRSMPSRYWDKDTKEWEIPGSKFSTFLDRVQGFDIEISGRITEMYTHERNKKQALDQQFQFKTDPFDHQIDGFKYGLTHDSWLLGDEQGLGKTKQVIDIAVAKKAEGFKHCLIICGVNGLKWNWVNEIHTHSNEDAYILGQRIKKGKIKIGSRNDKMHDSDNLDAIPAYFIITNVETLRDPDIQKSLQSQCDAGNISMVAIDEIHKCKNPSSQQGKGILKLQPKYRVAMTGTPLMNTPLDLYIILRWLGYERHAFYSFKNHYCVMGGYGGYEVVSYKHLDELQDQLDSIMLRRRKEDVLDLPEKIYVDEYVEMTTKQEQIYKEVSADIKANIDKIKIASNPLAELIRMRQATGFTGILSSDVLESAKLDRLEELIEEATSNGKKVVVFSNWTQMTSVMYARLYNQYQPALITGETRDDERQDRVRRFQQNDDCKVIIGTIGAMGTGITLTAGTVVIFVDEPWTMANKQQAIDRCHRIGTQSNITVYTLMCKDTIDERIHEIVERKGAISDAIVDGKIIGNKAELLNFLLS